MPSPHVGTLREKPLHAALKQWYARAGDPVEVSVDGFVVDLVRDGELIEIQTRGFSSMKKKLVALIEHHAVRIVHPIAVDRWIVKVGEGGELLSRRLSPKHGGAADVFSELVAFPELVDNPNLTIEVVLTREDEIRTHDPTRAWRRRGWVVEERQLLEVVEQLSFEGSRDLAGLLPDLPEMFTTADLADALGSPRRLAQQMTYCLRKMQVVEQVSKRGNAAVYRAL